MNDKLELAKNNIIESIIKTAKKLPGNGFKFIEKIDKIKSMPVGPASMAEINQIKKEVVNEFKKFSSIKQTQEINNKLSSVVDINKPVYYTETGKTHPIGQVISLASDIASRMGFKLCYGPDIENEQNNFDALNIPSHHPARQMVDTFYLDNDKANEKMLLRTHTSSVQIRHLQNNKPPIKIFSVGRVFRKDSDATHTPMFHQMEILCINKTANMIELISTLKKFISHLLEQDNVQYRIRSSYFPFTEPSIELDIKINDQWLEVAGAGMVHPSILENSQIDSNIYQGYAWGLGLDRIAMIKYNIQDLRNMFNSNIQWLKYYGI